MSEEREVNVEETALKVGDIVDINGVSCKLTYINPGSYRMTFTTVPRKRAETEKNIERAAIEARVKKAQVGQ